MCIFAKNYITRTTKRKKEMKKLTTLFLLIACFGMNTWADEFSHTTPSGHTIMFEVYTNGNYQTMCAAYTTDTNISGDLIIPYSVTNNGTTYTVNEIQYRGFENCAGLTSVSIPNSVKSIGHTAFKNCTNLVSVTLPDTLNQIVSSTFAFCGNLTTINIPEGLEYIGYGCFEGCSSLNNITLPNGIGYLDGCAFRGCSSLTSINFPESLRSLGSSAFQYCTSLTNVTLPQSLETINGDCFFGCTSFTNITIPENVTNIGFGAFAECNNVTNINFNAVHCGVAFLPFGVYPMGTTLTISENATFIPDQLFNGLGGVEEIVIPNLVDTIGAYALSHCADLKRLTIGESVSFVGDYAFSGCSALEQITIFAPVPPLVIWGGDPFTDVPLDIPVYIPCGTLEAYSMEYPWHNFTDLREMCNSIEDANIEDYSVLVNNDAITIEGLNNNETISIVDVNGRTIVNESAINGKSYIMPQSGVYMVRINNSSKKVVIVK